ncbi:cytidylyltransferase domain-containing protein [Paenibacillus thalictri]|uniref:Acylneuraminate cytidylyltransferase family protein n=1 Tax=Paenibacillus thalictri TaxID=2527873 RepID=A0A4Q9DJD5_9BACL|nr:acylneuraminate cytidylyltransferase family protein [Paenibacillus thalictri]TBL73011.1 acylneuraminate cytidylyltransferase family protein [Paenibacillus thalictri]
MISGKRVLAIISARGGSKGVPRKNIRDICGKPLIAWSIHAAEQSKYIDRLILTSDDDEIISVARKWGCEVPFVRPSELAQDHTPGIDPVLHAVQQVPGYDLIVQLQPTSPMRLSEDIDGCLEKLIEQEADACVTVTEPEKSPYWMYSLGLDDQLVPVIKMSEFATRRQDLPKVYVLNGAVYVARTDWLLRQKTFLTEETIGYCMPSERSVDIDNEFDFFIVEQILYRNLKKSGDFHENISRG